MRLERWLIAILIIWPLALCGAPAHADEAGQLQFVPVEVYVDSGKLPLAAYQVSGEYAQIKAAAEKGWLDEPKVAVEALQAIRRAGADLILTYYARQVLDWL